jgi:hypothetical protein
MPQDQESANRETLWGSPQEEGIVHVIRHLVNEVIPGLVKATENSLARIEALEKRDAMRVAAERAKAIRDERWNDNFTKAAWTFGSGLALLVVRQIYVIFQPILTAHGFHVLGM